MRPDPPELLIRPARPTDDDALRRLAVLDEAPPPASPLLVAEVRGELWTAVSIESLDAIADPFRPTAALVALLRMRAGQVRELPSRPRWPRWR